MVKRILKSKITSWISLIVGILLTFAIIFLLVFHTDFFARRASMMLSRYFFSNTSFSLRIERLSGNPLNRLVMENLRVRYHGEDYSFDVVRVEKLACDYSIRSLFSSTPNVERVELIKPHIWIKPDSLGINIIPHTGGSSSSGGPVSFEVGYFYIKDGQFIYQGTDRADAVRKLDLQGTVVAGKDGVRVKISKGSGEDIRRDLFFRSVKGNIRWGEIEGGEKGKGDGGKRLYLDDLLVELDESMMIMNGSINPDSMSIDLNLAAEPFDVEEITRALGIETTHYGELQGALALRGIPGDLRLRGMVNGIFSGYALTSFRVDIAWKSPELRLINGYGVFNGAQVDARGEMSLAEPRTIAVQTAVRGFDLSAGFLPGKNMPSTFFNGDFRINYSSENGKMIFNLDLDRGHFRKFPFESGIINGSFQGDTISFSRIYLDSPDHTVESYGNMTTSGEIRFYLDLQCSREDTLFPYFDIEDYRADLVMNGLWEGSLDSWALRASGNCADLSYHWFDVPSGELSLVLDHKDSNEFSLEMRGDSCLVDSIGFSEIDLSLQYGSGITDIRRLHLVRKGFDVEISGDVSSDDGIVGIAVNQAAVEALEERWLSGGDFNISIADSTVRFKDLQFHSRQGAMFMDCTLNRDTGSIDGSFELERMGLSLLNAAGLVKEELSGRLNGNIICGGNRNNPEFSLDISTGHSTYGDLEADSLRIVAERSDGVTRIRKLHLISPEGSMELKGSVSGADPVDLVRGEYGSLDRSVLDLEVACTALSMDPFISFLEDPPIEGGYYSGYILLTDSLAHPRIEATGTVNDLTASYYHIPEAEMDVLLSKDGIDMEGSITLSPEHTAEFSGSIPVRMREWFYSVSGDERINIDIQLPEGDLAYFPEVTDVIAEADGRISAGFNVGGTVSDPRMSGELKLSGAGFRFSGMEERFRGVNARIMLEDTLLTIYELTGNEGREGSFSCSGTITLKGWAPDRYDLEASLDKVLIASITDVMAIVSGEMKIGTVTQDERKIPSITGDIDVNRAEVYFDIGEFSSAQKTGTMEPPSWIAAINLEVSGNTWIKTPDANVEMQGSVTIHHDQRGTYLRGRLDLLRGWYNVYNNKFRVTSGRLEFVSAEGFRPVVDINAETLDPEGRKIYLTLSWHQDDIEPRLALHHEDPGYSETDIWKMLGGGVVGSNGGEGSGWSALNTAQNLAANYIEKMLNSQMEGITIELETSGGSTTSEGGFEPKETMVAIGKYLSEGLYVKYKQGLSMSTARHFEVEYRISRLFQIRSEIIMYSEKLLHGGSQRSSDEYNVDLKLRWEF